MTLASLTFWLFVVRFALKSILRFLSFLMAPGAKSLARYHNVDIFIRWAANIFQY